MVSDSATTRAVALFLLILILGSSVVSFGLEEGLHSTFSATTSIVTIAYLFYVFLPFIVFELLP